jgi:hypothetical protein
MSGHKSVNGQPTVWAEETTETTSLAHEAKTSLMSILLNAEHLQALAQLAPQLREALSRAPLTPEHARALEGLLDELSPLSTDLLAEARHLRQLLETLDADGDVAEPPPLRSYGT